MKKIPLDGWNIDERGTLFKGPYVLSHYRESSSFYFNGNFSKEIIGDDHLYRNIQEIERRIETQEDFIVNGFHLYEVDDDAIYVAKSKEAVLEFCKSYGDIDDIFGRTEAEFIECIKEHNLASSYVHDEREIYEEEEGNKLSSYYQYYLKEANEKEDCVPIIYFNV